MNEDITKDMTEESKPSKISFGPIETSSGKHYNTEEEFKNAMTSHATRHTEDEEQYKYYPDVEENLNKLDREKLYAEKAANAKPTFWGSIAGRFGFGGTKKRKYKKRKIQKRKSTKKRKYRK